MTNLVITRGDDFSAKVTLSSDDEGTPFNLTGYTAKSQIRTGTAANADLIAEFTAEVTDAAAGEITLTLLHTVTEDLTRGGVWDLQIADGDDWITTVASGKVKIALDVTRDEVP